MTHEEEIREQRQALNAALNNHDLETATSFLHPDFVAQTLGVGCANFSFGRQTAWILR